MPLRSFPKYHTPARAHTHSQKQQAYCTHTYSRAHTCTDLLTSSVPVALLSERQLELGDNLIDFILSSLGLSEAWRRHFNCTASPQSPNLPLISPRRDRCLRAVSGLLLIDVSACFMSFWDMTALTHSTDFNQLATYRREWQLGKVRRTKKKKKTERERIGWGCHWLRSAPALSLTGGFSSLLMKMFHSHLTSHASLTDEFNRRKKRNE